MRPTDSNSQSIQLLQHLAPRQKHDIIAQNKQPAEKLNSRINATETILLKVQQNLWHIPYASSQVETNRR